MFQRKQVRLEDRIARENEHGRSVLERNEENWGWKTPAGRIRRARRATFLQEARGELPQGAQVLEVGCGTGTFTGDLAAVFPALTSIDVSDVLLDAAARRFPQVRFLKQDVHRTGFADASFDAVLGCSVLHHLEWEVALREMYRILKPGGMLRFSEPNLLNPQIFLQKKWPRLKRWMGDSPDESAFTPAQIRSGLENAGFVAISVRPFEFLHPSTPPRLIRAVIVLERLLEQTALVSCAGSMYIVATRP